jgi:hypothetical protein
MTTKTTATGGSGALRNDKQGQATATENAKCGGLSAAQQTMRLSVASVEMTLVFCQAEGRQRQRQRQQQQQLQRQPQVLRLRSSQVRELPFDCAQVRMTPFGWGERTNKNKHKDNRRFLRFAAE